MHDHCDWYMSRYHKILIWSSGPRSAEAKLSRGDWPLYVDTADFAGQPHKYHISCGKESRIALEGPHMAFAVRSAKGTENP